MKSLQGRLIITLTLTVIVLLAGIGIAFYWAVERDFTYQFDRSLEGDAEALSSLVQFHSDGRLEFEYDESSMPARQIRQARPEFAIRFADGTLFAKSKAWIEINPRPATNHLASDAPFPNGQNRRALRLDFIPHLDPDSPAGGTMRTWTDAPLSILVVRDRADLDDALRRFLGLVVVAAIMLGVAIVIAVGVVVRRGLRPLRGIRDGVTGIEPTSLHTRLPTEGLPTELAPICACLNDLLSRLEQAFRRERRFTSDVAHELRTPIAELRSVTEIALRHPDDAGLAEIAIRDSLDIAKQMQTLVNTLLSLVRSERTTVTNLQRVPLAEAIEKVIRELSLCPADVVCEVPDDAVVMAEPSLLASSLRNIIANGVEYRTGQAAVRCAAVPSGDGWRLSVENEAQGLSDDDLPHLFDPFWRKDSARSNSAHAGLGLALVKAYCDLMKAKASIHLDSGRRFRLTLEFPLSSEASTAGISPGSQNADSNVNLSHAASRLRP